MRKFSRWGSLMNSIVLWMLGFTLAFVAACTQGQEAASSSSSSASVLPQNNPVNELYPGEYPWTDKLQWDFVVNIEDYGGFGNDTKDDLDAFQAASKVIESKGVGVIYFPAGTYYFRDSIQLQDRMILRGATPKNRDGTSKNFKPPTRFEFPEYKPTFVGGGTPNDTAFKMIQAKWQSSDVGFVWLDINRARIEAQISQRGVLLGIRQNNAAIPDEVPLDYQNPWQRHAHPQIPSIYGWGSQWLVARCRLNDEITDNFTESNYKVRAKDGSIIETKYEFSYTDHLMLWFLNTSDSVFRDNYIYHTARVAIGVYGNGFKQAGNGGRNIILNNVIRDKTGKVATVDPTGTLNFDVNLASTYENRGIDFNGYNIRIEGNDIETHQHHFEGTPYNSVDGEGILIQPHTGNDPNLGLDGLIIRGNTLNSYIGLYFAGNMQNVEIVDNKVTAGHWTGNGLIFVATGSPYWAKNVTISGNVLDGAGIADTGGLEFQANTGAKNITIRNNRMTKYLAVDCGQGDDNSGNKVYGNTYGTDLKVNPNCAADVHDNVRDPDG